jgi:hypothetical protein
MVELIAVVLMLLWGAAIAMYIYNLYKTVVLWIGPAPAVGLGIARLAGVFIPPVGVVMGFVKNPSNEAMMDALVAQQAEQQRLHAEAVERLQAKSN